VTKREKVAWTWMMLVEEIEWDKVGWIVWVHVGTTKGYIIKINATLFGEVITSMSVCGRIPKYRCAMVRLS
jgi:hypothetical protein